MTPRPAPTWSLTIDATRAELVPGARLTEWVIEGHGPPPTIEVLVPDATKESDPCDA